MGETEQRRFGSVVRGTREKQGWSQNELGRKAGVSRPTTARVLANREVTTATIAKAAQALGSKLELR